MGVYLSKVIDLDLRIEHFKVYKLYLNKVLL